MPIARCRWTLCDDLWDGEAPASAKATVRTYCSQLRKLPVDGMAIGAEGSGYRMRLPCGALDAARFEELVQETAGEVDLDRRIGLASGAFAL